MTSKSKTLKTKVTPAAKKPEAKVPAKVVKAVAAKKVISAKLGEKIKAAIVTKAKVEDTKTVKPVLKSVFGNQNNKAVIVPAKKKAPAKKAVVKNVTKPVTVFKTVSSPKPDNTMTRSKLVPAGAVVDKPKVSTTLVKSSSPNRTISMSDLAKNINAATQAPKTPSVTAKRDEDVGASYLRTTTIEKPKGLSMSEVMSRITPAVPSGNLFPIKR